MGESPIGILEQIPVTNPSKTLELGFASSRETRHIKTPIEQQKIARSEARAALEGADEIIFDLHSSMIGEAVVATGYLQSTLKTLKLLGKSTPIKLLIGKEHQGLLSGYQSDQISVEVHEDENWNPATDDNYIKQKTGDNLLILDFNGQHERGNTTITTNLNSVANKKVTIMDNLFASAVYMFPNDLYGEARYDTFMQSLFDFPQNSFYSQQSQPYIPLAANEAEQYDRLTQELKIDRDAIQVGIVTEASAIGKRYSLQNWEKVLTKMAQDLAILYPDKKVNFNIFYNPSSRVGGFTYYDLAKTFTKATSQDNNKYGCTLIGTDIKNLPVLFRHQNIVVSNDTGLAHIAAAVQDGPSVLTLFLPHVFTKEDWISTKRMRGISPDPQCAGVKEVFYSLDRDGHVINKIDPNVVSQLALDVLKKAA